MKKEIIPNNSAKDLEVTKKELLSYYETEAEEVPLFGSLREIALAENIIKRIPKKFKTLIDIGCGEGYLLSEVKKSLHFQQLYGYDLSKGRLITTKKNIPSVFLVRGDVLSLPFPDASFDIVICSELLEHITEYQQVIDELVRIVKHKIIITVPYEQAVVPIRCPRCNTKHFLDGHVNYFDEKKLRQACEKYKKMQITEIHKFHTIFTFNRMTMKLPRLVRLCLDKMCTSIHNQITFLKPNYLLICIEKVEEEK